MMPESPVRIVIRSEERAIDVRLSYAIRNYSFMLGTSVIGSSLNASRG